MPLTRLLSMSEFSNKMRRRTMGMDNADDKVSPEGDVSNVAIYVSSTVITICDYAVKCQEVEFKLATLYVVMSK